MLVSKVLCERQIGFNPLLVPACGGSVEAALMMAQALYWSDGRTTLPDGWFYKTQDDWEEETGVGRYEQKSARNRLLALGFIEEKLKGIPARLHFRINHEVLSEALVKAKKAVYAKRAEKAAKYSMGTRPKLVVGPDSGSVENQPQSITEITSKTTNTHPEPASPAGFNLEPPTPKVKRGTGTPTGCPEHLPLVLDNPECRKLIAEWIKHRKDIGHRISLSALESLINSLRVDGTEVAIERLEYSISQGNQKFYQKSELPKYRQAMWDQKRNGTYSTQTPPPSQEDKQASKDVAEYRHQYGRKRTEWINALPADRRTTLLATLTEHERNEARKLIQ